MDFLIRFPFPKDSEVTALTVLHRDLFGEHEDEEFSDEQRKALLEAQEAVREEGERLAAEAALDWLQKEVSWRTPNVSVELREAPNVAHEILDATAEFSSDLVMLGDKGKSDIERFLLGSVTRRVATHSPCSVWVVRDA